MKARLIQTYDGAPGAQAFPVRAVNDVVVLQRGPSIVDAAGGGSDETILDPGTVVALDAESKTAVSRAGAPLALQLLDYQTGRPCILDAGIAAISPEDAAFAADGRIYLIDAVERDVFVLDRRLELAAVIPIGAFVAEGFAPNGLIGVDAPGRLWLRSGMVGGLFEVG